jgi:hypothetical protein
MARNLRQKYIMFLLTKTKCPELIGLPAEALAKAGGGGVHLIEHLNGLNKWIK